MAFSWFPKHIFDQKSPSLTFSKQKYDLTVLSQRSDVNEMSRRILSALLDSQNVFEAAVLDQNRMIIDLHQDMTSLTMNEHLATREIIVYAVRGAGQGRRSEMDVSGNAERRDADARRRAEDQILRSLQFPSISERYNKVAKAHAATFEWIFSDPQPEDRPWSSFSQWLQSGEGIYWINGKAGSGKSTLMRYLYDHERTRALFSTWSGSKPLQIASHFFWNSGTSEQKSQVGLLRSLLHEILSIHRDLIPDAFPNEWKDEYAYPSDWQLLKWNFHNTMKAFDVIRTQEDFQLCLFIDGLDEYEGDRDGGFADMIALFTQLASSSNIKICLSSRPWLVFEDAFQSFPRLRLQGLTFSDIQQYVDDKVSNHRRMNQLRNSDPGNAEDLVAEVVKKASGVFLWVVLVVDSLLEGLTNRDRIADLQKRVALLPADLEDLYGHMLLKHIDPFYHEQSSQIFQIFCAAEFAPFLSALTLEFALEADTSLALTSPITPRRITDLDIRCSEMTDMLKSRCGGLLEVSEGSSASVSESEEDTDQTPVSNVDVASSGDTKTR